MKALTLHPCDPPGWADGGHLQTLLGFLLPSPKLKDFGRRVDIALPDGDTNVGFYRRGTTGTLVYLFHGLTGNVRSNYMQRTALLCQSVGHHVFLMNHRGCGEGIGRAFQPYHSGRAEDLSEAIRWGRNTFPRLHHVAIGFSLSGNALLLLVGGGRGNVQPDAAVSVNPPIHLEGAALSLKRGWNRVYDMHFVLACRAEASRRHNGRPEQPRYQRIPRFTTLHDFDDLYTAPASGFLTREDYYARCSAKQFIGRIDKPTIILTAHDDPFVLADDFRNLPLSPHVQLHIERKGGHLGYLSARRGEMPFRWLDYALGQALRALAG